jgi:hypothetical protein
MSNEIISPKEEIKEAATITQEDANRKEALEISKQIFALAKKYMELTGDKGFTLKIGNHV